MKTLYRILYMALYNLVMLLNRRGETDSDIVRYNDNNEVAIAAYDIETDSYLILFCANNQYADSYAATSEDAIEQLEGFGYKYEEYL